MNSSVSGFYLAIIGWFVKAVLDETGKLLAGER